MPTCSESLKHYLLVSYGEQGNYIHFTVMQSLSGAAYTLAYTEVLQFFRKRGINPGIIRIDNQTSSELDTFLELNGAVSDLVPPNDKRTNKAERCIQTGKNHIVASLAGTDPSFPLKLSIHTVRQNELTLNMLRSSGVSGTMSAYQQLHGIFDYMHTPLAPIGMKVVTYNDCDV